MCHCLSSVSSAMEDVNKPDVKNEEEGVGGVCNHVDEQMSYTHVCDIQGLQCLASAEATGIEAPSLDTSQC